MVANNLVEVFTLLFAWGLYGAIWDLLVGTGLALIPFLAAILSSFHDGVSIGETADDVINDLIIKVLILLLVMTMCVMPYKGWGVSMAGLKYDLASNDCNPPANTNGTGDNTQTSLDQQLSALGGSDIYIPLAWSLVNLVSTGITNSSIRSMQCVNDYEFLMVKMSNIRIKSDQLRARVNDFRQQCYLVARDRYKQLGISVGNDVNQLDNVDWLGSRYFLDPVGEFYQHREAYMANMEKYGFTRQASTRYSDMARSSGAHPSCKEVWEGERVGGSVDETKGLRYLILQDIDVDDADDAFDDWKDWGHNLSKLDLTETDKEDLFIKYVLKADAANLHTLKKLDMSDGLDVSQSTAKQVSDWVLGMAGAVMGADEYLQGTTIRQVMKIAGPMIIAMLQMVIIFGAPLIMAMGNFKFTTFTALAMTYFAFEFIHVIWAAAYWMNNNLILFWAEEASVTDAFTGLLLNAVTAMSVVFLPMIWLTMCAYVGTGMLRGMGAMGVGGGSALGSRAFKGGLKVPKPK